MTNQRDILKRHCDDLKALFCDGISDSSDVLKKMSTAESCPDGSIKLELYVPFEKDKLKQKFKTSDGTLYKIEESQTESEYVKICNGERIQTDVTVLLLVKEESRPSEMCAKIARAFNLIFFLIVFFLFVNHVALHPVNIFR